MGLAYWGSYAWVLAGLGDTHRARAELAATMAAPHAFDVNSLSLQVERAEASLVDDPTSAAKLYDRLAPYAAVPPAPAARRAVTERSIAPSAALPPCSAETTRPCAT